EGEEFTDQWINGAAGMFLNQEVESDTGLRGDLNKVKWEERLVDYAPQGSFQNVNIKWNTTPPDYATNFFNDFHGVPTNGLVAIYGGAGGIAGPGSIKADQLHLFWCERCGMTQQHKQAAPSSGF